MQHQQHEGRAINVTIGDLTTAGSSNIINAGVFLGHEDQATNPEKCRNVLFLSDPAIDRATLVSEKGKRVAGTCEWIRNDVAYQSWRTGDTNLLWINGGPGKGKTMLSIFLTQELEREVETIYYFCSSNASERNTAAAVLRGLIWHITSRRSQLADLLLVYFAGDTKTQTILDSPETLWAIFVKLLQDPRVCTLYCVLDGLDECDEDSQRWLVAKIVDLWSDDALGSNHVIFKIAIISRPVIGLAQCTQVRLDPDNNQQVGKDIQSFVKFRVEELAARVSLPDGLRREIEATMLERSEGTFLWVGFATIELFKKRTATEVKEALQALPKGLPGIYGRMLLLIEESQKVTSLLILKWVTLTFRLLSLLDLADAIDIQASRHISREQAALDQISNCGAFIKVEHETVSLVHQSARDYLLRSEKDENPVLEWFRIKPEEAHLDLALACIDRLMIDSAQGQEMGAIYKPKGAGGATPREYAQRYLMRDYATRHWLDHARGACTLWTHLLKKEGFFQELSGSWRTWWRWYGIIHRRTVSRMHLPIPGDGCPALLIACYIGFLPWAQALLAKTKAPRLRFSRIRSPVEQRDTTGCTALWWAASEGHEAVVRLLVSASKADVNARDNDGQTPLWIASFRGHETVARQLVTTTKVDVDARDRAGRTPLWIASSKGHVTVVQLLLATGKADVDVQSFSAQTPLSRAASEGHETVVQLLLDTEKVNVDARDNRGYTPLWRATWNNHEVVVQLLLATGKADVDAQDEDGRTPLSVAMEGGYGTIVQLLQDYRSRLSEAN